MTDWILSALALLMSYKVTPKRILSCLEAGGASDKRNAEFVAPEATRLAAVQLDRLVYRDINDYAKALLSHAKTAVDAGAQLVVYPEYVGLLPLSLVPMHRQILEWIFDGALPDSPEKAAPLPARLERVVELFHDFLQETYLCTFSTIARLQHVCVVAGSCLFYEEGALHHRAVVFGPDGKPLGVQERVNAIGLDRALGVVAVAQAEPIQTPLGPLGVVLGSDAYYFECFKILREKGAQLIAVPASQSGVLTDLLRCRADENGVYALYSCYSGKGCGGRAGIFAPLAVTPRHDGIAAQAQSADAQALTLRVDRTRLDRVLPGSDPNPAFLSGDYLHSYRYSGRLPLVTPPDAE